MAFTGSTLDMTQSSKQYVSPAQISFDVNAWNLKDSAAGTTYLGYTQTSNDQNKFVWKIRKEVLSGNITTIGYANNGDGLYNYAWSGRTGYSYR